VESFIPLWDWDIPKKKTRKKKADKTGEKKKGKAPALQGENGIGGRMTIEEVDDSEHSRPASRARAVTVEDVPEDE
jgi:translocation protein SEC62